MSQPAFPQILAGLKSGLDTVEKLMPLTALGGPMGLSVGQIAGTLIDIGQAAIDATTNGMIVATSDDEAEVRRILKALQEKNDANNAYIRQS